MRWVITYGLSFTRKMELMELMLILTAFLVAGYVQGIIGFGFAVTTTLLLVNRLDFTSLVFLNLFTSLVTTCIAMLSAKNIKAIHKRTLLKIILSALAGLCCGIMIIHNVDTAALKKIALGVILLASVLSLTQNRVLFAHHYLSWIGGFFSGVLTPSTGINGPLVALHLNAALEDKQQKRQTMLSYLFLMMFSGVISLSVQRDFPVETWDMLPKVLVPAVLGYVLGMLSFRLLSNQLFKVAVTLFLIVSTLVSLLYLMV